MILELTNNHMNLQLVAIVSRDIKDSLDNVAIMYRKNDNTFIVVSNLAVYKDNTCNWAFAYCYDIETLKEATELMITKLK